MTESNARSPETKPKANPLSNAEPLGFMWRTRDPFLFCVHHDDRYPVANEKMGPAASLAGRRLGSDFEPLDGWRMYHGRTVPGFPRHPHRGFETVTVVRRGLLDHADSLGAGARYGGGDVQWLTAGGGVQHAEMFPLLDRKNANPVELFQIWLNLPSASKMVAPHFKMLWSDQISTQSTTDESNRRTDVTVVAGKYADTGAPTPPPESWAADPAHDVAIWTIKMQPGARWSLPPAGAGTLRSLYVFEGAGLQANGHSVPSGHQFDVEASDAVELENSTVETEMLLLQGRPIGESVARHGPFVMNTRAELQQAYADYHRTGFGQWPWSDDAPVHPREEGRFARHPDGRIEKPG